MSDCPFPSSSEFIKRMRLILAREWTDTEGGRGAVDMFDGLWREGRLEFDGSLLRYTEDVMVACKRGNVVPGYGLDLDTEQCVMDWPAFACFARWYALSGNRDAILAELKKGNPAPWTAPGMPKPPYPCAPNDPINQMCCPSSVWLDPFYQEPVVERSSFAPAVAVAASAAIAFGALWWLTKGKI